MKNFISTNFLQFPYFDLQLNKPDWKNKKVLDFGGNTGNILAHPDATISPGKYWCIDVSQDAITGGQQLFPEAHFVHYDRYNFSFNPDGIPGLALPQLHEMFDIIISYSVFTATSPGEMLEIVKQLEMLLAPGGILAFSFNDPEYNPYTYDSRYHNMDNFFLRLQRINDGYADPELILKNRNSKWSILVNGKDLFVETENIPFYPENERKIYSSFFTREFIKNSFPHSQVSAPPLEAYPFDHAAEMQHACIIQKPG